ASALGRVASDTMLFNRIQGQIQLQNINSRFAEKSEIRQICILGNKFSNCLFTFAASLGDALALEFRVTKADVWIETAARRRHSIGGNRVSLLQSVFFSIHLNPILNCVVQLLRGRAEVAAP